MTTVITYPYHFKMLPTFKGYNQKFEDISTINYRDINFIDAPFNIVETIVRKECHTLIKYNYLMGDYTVKTDYLLEMC